MAMCCQREFETSIRDIDHETFIRYLMLVAFEVVKTSRRATKGEGPSEPSISEKYLEAFQNMCTSKYVQGRVIPEKAMSYY